MGFKMETQEAPHQWDRVKKIGSMYVAVLLMVVPGFGAIGPPLSCYLVAASQVCASLVVVPVFHFVFALVRAPLQ